MDLDKAYPVESLSFPPPHVQADCFYKKSYASIICRMSNSETHRRDTPNDGMLLVEEITGNAAIPSRGSAEAAGLDIYSSCEQKIRRQDVGIISTGVRVLIPPGCYGKISPQSRLSWEKHMSIAEEIIDSNFTEEIRITVFNHSERNDITVKKGEKVAQLICQEYCAPVPLPVQTLPRTIPRFSVILYKEMSSQATPLVRRGCMSAGFLLHSAADYILAPKGKIIINTDIQVKVPSGTCGRIAPLTGVPAIQHTTIAADVIDSDHTGNIGILLFNHSNTAIDIQRGSKVAQLICERILVPTPIKVKEFPDSSNRDRGFGSTDPQDQPEENCNDGRLNVC